MQDELTYLLNSNRVTVVIMTYLTVAIQVTNLDSTIAACRAAISAGAEMIELRLDYLETPQPALVQEIIKAVQEMFTCPNVISLNTSNLRKISKQSQYPLIATCRPRWEGGYFKGSEEERQMLLLTAVKAGAEYVDIELACLDQPECGVSGLLEQSGDQVILSSHDFEGKPADLSQLMATMQQRRQAAVSKVAYQANEIGDCFDVLDLLHRKQELGEVIGLAMGEAGMMTRVLAKKLGAFLTFVSVAESEGTAPGQITVEEMKEVYRWDSLEGDTVVSGVIVNPIYHSKSPAVHNAGFTEIGFNGVYLPFLVETPWNKFRDFVDGLREREWLNVRGLSVTIPHKHNALQYVQEKGRRLEPLAGKIGSVNTLVLDKDGLVSGYNTDYAGALDAITDTLGIERADLRGMPAAIVGAGGVARALAAGLTDAGCKVTIYNRTVEKAVDLAAEFECEYAGLDGLATMEAQLVVNATRIGMYPEVEASPLPAKCLRRDMAVFDTVYNPSKTLLLQQAEDIGAKIIDGMSMFVNQAATQFELFTGKKAPRGVMRAVLERHLL